jgi:hypothetical protein
MSDFSPLILGLGGTARPNSTSEKSVRVALAAAEKMGARTILIDGPHLARLPLYAPDRVERTEDEIAFVEAARGCDGIIVATPGYHGSLSGPIKNALDLLEDTSRDERTYLDGCAFGSIVTAFGWDGMRYHDGDVALDRARAAGLADALWRRAQRVDALVRDGRELHRFQGRGAVGDRRAAGGGLRALAACGVEQIKSSPARGGGPFRRNGGAGPPPATRAPRTPSTTPLRAAVPLPVPGRIIVTDPADIPRSRRPPDRASSVPYRCGSPAFRAPRRANRFP